MRFVGEIVGYVGIFLSILIYIQGKRKNLVFFKLVSDVVWCVHYTLLGAYSGAAIGFIAIFREFVFLNKGKKWADNKLWFIFFLVLSPTASIITGKNLYCFLPAIAAFLSVFCFYQSKAKKSRYFAIPISLCMLTYDILVSSTQGIINEIFTMSSIFIGFIVNDIVKKRKEK